MRAEWEVVSSLGARMLALGEATGDPLSRAAGLFTLGNAELFMGRLRDSRRHIDDAIAIARPLWEQSPEVAFLLGEPTGVRPGRRGPRAWPCPTTRSRRRPPCGEAGDLADARRSPVLAGGRAPVRRHQARLARSRGRGPGRGGALHRPRPGHRPAGDGRRRGRDQELGDRPAPIRDRRSWRSSGPTSPPATTPASACGGPSASRSSPTPAPEARRWEEAVAAADEGLAQCDASRRAGLRGRAASPPGIGAGGHRPERGDDAEASIRRAISVAREQGATLFLHLASDALDRFLASIPEASRSMASPCPATAPADQFKAG